MCDAEKCGEVIADIVENADIVEMFDIAVAIGERGEY